MTQIDLKQTLGSEPVRARVISDCVTLIDEQVAAKSGLSGAAIKTAYATIKRIKKGFVAGVIDGMLDDWMDGLQSHFDAWLGSGDSRGSLEAFLRGRSNEVSEVLLSVTDKRAERSKHKTAKKAYLKMRGSAKDHVSQAVPPLGRTIERRLSSEGLLS